MLLLLRDVLGAAAELMAAAAAAAGAAPSAATAALVDAVTRLDVGAVEVALKAGGDPAYRAAAPPPNDFDALALLVFRISDCTLQPNDLRDCEAIAATLLAAGADATRARALSVERYGPLAPVADPADAFDRVRRLVHGATTATDAAAE